MLSTLLSLTLSQPLDTTSLYDSYSMKNIVEYDWSQSFNDYIYPLNEEGEFDNSLCIGYERGYENLADLDRGTLMCMVAEQNHINHQNLATQRAYEYDNRERYYMALTDVILYRGLDEEASDGCYLDTITVTIDGLELRIPYEYKKFKAGTVIKMSKQELEQYQVYGSYDELDVDLTNN